tara:strand:- start:1784 stop:2065 length:282 start_codon:yes stop_codon:yes gene_type:complete
MFVKLHKISQRSTGEYYLSEIVVNTSHITYLSEDARMAELLQEGKIKLGLNKITQFTKIRIVSNKQLDELTVVGDISMIESKINKSNKKLLWG